MGTQNNINSPVSPQEWYETGVLLRSQERFGEAINAFARAAELASEEINAVKVTSPDGAASFEGSVPFSENEFFIEDTTRQGGDCQKISELERIKAASLAFIDLIREINSFANTDLMNP